MSLSGDSLAGRRPDGWQPVRHVRPSLRIGEIVSLCGALLLLIAMVALRWYGAAGTGGLERTGPSRSLGVWETMSVARWLMAATVALTLGVAGVRAVRRLRSPAAVAGGTAAPVALVVAGGATALVVAYRVLISPPQPDRVLDVKLGAELGLAGAVAIAAGTWESWRGGRAGSRPGSADGHSGRRWAR